MRRPVTKRTSIKYKKKQLDSPFLPFAGEKGFALMGPIGYKNFELLNIF